MRVIADLHGGDLEDTSAKTEFQEIKDRVNFDVSSYLFFGLHGTLKPLQRASGEARSYKIMWKRYKRRVLLAMSSQAFAQLVSTNDCATSAATNSFCFRTASTVCTHPRLFSISPLINEPLFSHFILCTYVQPTRAVRTSFNNTV